MKNFLNFFLIIIFLAAFQLPVWADENKTKERDTLIAKARSEGIVKVIVKINVENIKKLIKESTNNKAKTPEREFPSGGYKADSELAFAISFATNSVLSKLSTQSYKVNNTYSTIPFVALDVTEEALLKLESMPEVLSIVEDRKVKLPEPNVDDETTLNPSLDKSNEVIGTENAWSVGFTGEDWFIAVIDTGIRNTHKFFSGKKIVEACFIDCPDGSNEQHGEGSAAHDTNAYDGWDHGTHVTGIATGDNGNISGVAKGANIIAVQVFDKTGFAQFSTIDKALEHIYSIRGDYNIASVNMSIGAGAFANTETCDNAFPSTKAAIDNLRSAGIGTVIASGNEFFCGFISGPACISSAIAVSASDDNDKEAIFSNTSDLIDIFAPGVGIYSSTGDSDSSFEAWDGTSMAAPHVAGAFGIFKGQNPNASVDELISISKNTGKTPLNFLFCTEAETVPRINVDTASRGVEFSPWISGDSGCFIASITSGSSLYPHIKVLRDFRDKYLLRTQLGRYFISLYYEYSPVLTEFVKGNEPLKVVIRVGLIPLVYSFKFPYLAGIIVLGLIIIISSIAIKRKTLRRAVVYTIFILLISASFIMGITVKEADAMDWGIYATGGIGRASLNGAFGEVDYDTDSDIHYGGGLVLGSVFNINRIYRLNIGYEKHTADVGDLPELNLNSLVLDNTIGFPITTSFWAGPQLRLSYSMGDFPSSVYDADVSLFGAGLGAVLGIEMGAISLSGGYRFTYYSGSLESGSLDEDTKFNEHLLFINAAFFFTGSP